VLLQRGAAWLAFVLVLGACVPPEQAARVVAYDDDTLAGQIQARGVLVVGIDPTYPRLSAPAGPGAYEGFLVDLAARFAEAMGVEIAYKTAPSRLLPTLARAKVIDVGMPLLPITERSVRRANLLDPYYVAHQMLLVERGSPISQVADLAGETVCSAAHGETATDLSAVEPSLEVVRAERAAGCLKRLRAGEVAAISAPDYDLIGLAATTPGLEIVGDELSTFGVGPVIGVGTAGFNSVLEAFMARFDEDGTWLELYRRWLAPYLPEARTTAPSMDLEDAAALWPAT
jgi:ABC-type amino acid transport substrate-binding protein